MKEEEKNFLLFDLDGTLTLPREKIQQDMIETLLEIKKQDNWQIGIVGGGTLEHMEDQLGEFIKEIDYIFSENGTKTLYKNKLIFEEKIKDIIGNEAIKEIANFCLKYMSEVELPFKRGTFFELRTGLANICPMGRNCTYEERLFFVEYDEKHKILKKFRDELDANYSKKYNLVFSLGSSVSIDMFIEGYRKPFCLQFIKNKDIYFFGDKTSPGGNDYEISIDNRIKESFTVKNPHDTICLLNKIVFKK